MLKAIGLIETKGLAGAVGAADAAVKSANVRLLGKQIIDSAHVTIFITGELADVETGVASGAGSAKRIGELLAACVIPNPAEQLKIILPEINFEEQEQPFRKSAPVNTSKKINKIPPKNNIEEHTSQDEHDKKSGVEPKKKTEHPLSEIEKPAEVFSNKKNTANKKEKIIKEIKEEPDKKTEAAEQNSKAKTPAKNEKLDMSKPVKRRKQAAYKQNSTITRLRQEALFGDEHFEDPVKEDISEEVIEKVPVQREEKNFIAAANSEKAVPLLEKNNLAEEKNSADDEYENMNVHQLRKLARSTDDFPIQGREISRANRSVLINYFRGIKK